MIQYVILVIKARWDEKSMRTELFQNNKLIFLDGHHAADAGWSSGNRRKSAIWFARSWLHPSIRPMPKPVQIITANTFGANSMKMKPIGYSPEEVIKRAVTIARQAAGSRMVALDVGPLGQLMAPMGTLSFNDACAEFAMQIRAGQQAGADLILIETMSDLYEAKAAVLVAGGSQAACDLQPDLSEEWQNPDGNDPDGGNRAGISGGGCLRRKLLSRAGGLRCLLSGS